MRPTKFIADRWVRFIHERQICIGVTYLYDKTDPAEIFYHLVNYLKPDGSNGVISFYNCFRLRYARITPRIDELMEVTYKNEPFTLETWVDLVIDPLISREKTRQLAKSQVTQQN